MKCNVFLNVTCLPIFSTSILHIEPPAPQELKNVVEIDETFVGGKYKNKHASKKEPGSQGRSLKGKTPVFGALQRHGKVRATVITDTKNETLIPVIVNYIKKGSIMVSDEWYSPKILSPWFKHVIIEHKVEEYVRGAFHTNTIEGFWSLLKRGIYGIYHQVSAKHLQRYVDEFAARYNSRDIKDNERFQICVKNNEGGLKYNQLIGK